MQPRQKLFEPGRHEAPRAHQVVDLVGDRVAHHEDGKRDDAELVQHRVDAVDGDEAVVAGLLERPAFFEEAHAERNDQDLDDPEHEDLDGIESRLVPFHQAEPEQQRADQALEKPGLDVHPDVDEVAPTI